MPVLPLLALAGAGASIYSGLSANSAARQEAALERQQGNIAMSEAQVNAKNEAFNQTQAVQNQRVAFLANGVTLEGSPAMVLEQSKEYGQSQVDAILRQGAAKKALSDAEATITQNKGRAALIGGILQAGSKGYQSGLFDTGANSVGNTSDADVWKASVAKPGTLG
jgi:hypothetical protein